MKHKKQKQSKPKIVRTVNFNCAYVSKMAVRIAIDKQNIQCWMNNQRPDALLVVRQSDQRLAGCEIPQTNRCIVACSYHLDKSTIKHYHKQGHRHMH